MCSTSVLGFREQSTETERTDGRRDVLVGTSRVFSKSFLGCGGGSQGPVATPCSNRKTAPQGAVFSFPCLQRVKPACADFSRLRLPRWCRALNHFSPRVGPTGLACSLRLPSRRLSLFVEAVIGSEAADAVQVRGVSAKITARPGQLDLHPPAPPAVARSTAQSIFWTLHAVSDEVVAADTLVVLSSGT